MDQQEQYKLRDLKWERAADLTPAVGTAQISEMWTAIPGSCSKQIQSFRQLLVWEVPLWS